MTTRLEQNSLVQEVFDLYTGWNTQISLYLLTLILGTGTALVLDLRYHMPRGRVLLYVLPLTMIFMIVLPFAYAVWRGGTQKVTRDAIRSVLTDMLPGFPVTVLSKASTSRTESSKDYAAFLDLVSAWYKEVDTRTTLEPGKHKFYLLPHRLTALRFRQLELRLNQSAMSPQVKATLRAVLSGLRIVAEGGVAIPEEASEDYRKGFEKGFDQAAAAVFEKVAAVIAEAHYEAHRENYPTDNPEQTLHQLTEQELYWLFKHEQQP